MQPAEPSELLKYLGTSHLLSHGQMEMLEREGSNHSSVDALLGDILQRGWITSYQHKIILAGDAEKLTLGPYKVLETLGEGGMGVVYKAWHPRLERTVALKVIRPQVLAMKPDLIHRFHREARAIAQLLHPNVVVLYDADESQGTHYLAMEYVEGLTLEKMVRLNGPMPLRQACDYIRQAALGLQHAYECGLVHRDIKPSNMLIAQRSASKSAFLRRSSAFMRRPLITQMDRDLSQRPTGGSDESPRANLAHPWGVLKVLDMGLARLTETLEDEGGSTPLTKAGSLLGTPDFISPEQARDARRVDIRSDLYSLGCTFYYLLTGRPPFPGGNDVQKLLKHQNEYPTPLEELRPHLPSQMVQIVNKLLRKKPEERYQSPQELADDLAVYLAQALAAENDPERKMTPTGNHGAPAQVRSGAGPQGNGFQLPKLDPRFIAAQQHATEDVGTRVAEPAAMQQRVPTSPPILPRPQIPGAIPRPGVPNRNNGAVGEAEVPARNNSGMFPVAGAKQGINSRNQTIPAHVGLVGSVALSPDCKFAASGGIDGHIHLWDLSTSTPGQIGSLPRIETEIEFLEFVPDQQLLVIGGVQKGSARFWCWDWTNGCVHDWGSFTSKGSHIGAGCMAGDGKQFAAAIGPGIATWRLNGAEGAISGGLKGHNQPVRALTYAPDRKTLVSGGEGKGPWIWTFGWLGASVKYRFGGHTDLVSAVSFSCDGRRFVSGSIDHTVALWDANQGPEQKPTFLSGHTHTVRGARFLPDGRHLVTVDESGMAIFWDLVTGHKLRQISISAGVVTSICLAAQGNMTVTGCWDGRIHFHYFDALPSSNQSMVAAPIAAQPVRIGR
jgi:serine/threonine protein kinase/WD40 repeat protein